MGDRGNIVLTGKETFGKARVYLYTHWGGRCRHETLAAALDRGRGRWSDGSYISRIIFSDFVGSEECHRAETGTGLSCVPTDNSYPFLVVDVDANTVIEEPDRRKGFDIALRDDSIREAMPFENFIVKFKVNTIEAGKAGATLTAARLEATPSAHAPHRTGDRGAMSPRRRLND